MSRLLFLGTPKEANYLARLKPLVRTSTVTPLLTTPTTVTEIEVACIKRNITGILTTNPQFLAKLMPAKEWKSKLPSLDNYAGSYFRTAKERLEVVALPPLEQLVTVPHAPFLTERYASKLTAPEEWAAKKLPALGHFHATWDIYGQSHTTASKFQEYLNSCQLIAIDIETIRDPLRITCISFTGIRTVDDFRTLTIPLDTQDAYILTKNICQNAVAKVFQNGKYDIAYLLHYDIIVQNYIADTANMMHSWLSELPKDLASIGAFLVRDCMYWKDLAKTNDMQEYYKYNALDTWTTAWAAISWLQEAPAWARANYVAEFPVVFPCIMSEMRGIKRDMVALTAANTQLTARIEKDTASLSKSCGVAAFNPASPKQVATLLKVLGHKDEDSTDEKTLQKCSFLHPLSNWYLQKILDIRGDRKLVSTYLTPGKEYKGRILWSLNPHGTDTTRLASTEHHFWCGLQVQNIPRGDAVKCTLMADEGFLLGECDLEQAESRDTAHIAGDEALIKAVTGPRDFHSVNASAFFGVPYSQIFDDHTKKTLDKALRDLAKRVNHGANYNMGANVLIQTMGLPKIYEAARLLHLPAGWSLKQIAEHLLAAFHAAYPGIAKNYYAGMLRQVITTKQIKSKATHIPQPEYSIAGLYDEEAWFAGCDTLTRRCFKSPDKNKLHLNSYIAHEPQSLNAQTLNRAFVRVFYNIAIHPEYSQHFKLLAQIHDSIFFQYRKGHEYLASMVQDMMQVNVRVLGYDGKSREFVVPAAAKIGGTHWHDL